MQSPHSGRGDVDRDSSSSGSQGKTRPQLLLGGTKTMTGTAGIYTLDISHKIHSTFTRASSRSDLNLQGCDVSSVNGVDVRCPMLGGLSPVETVRTRLRNPEVLGRSRGLMM